MEKKWINSDRPFESALDQIYDLECKIDDLER